MIDRIVISYANSAAGVLFLFQLGFTSTQYVTRIIINLLKFSHNLIMKYFALFIYRTLVA